ncbi:MAG: FAD-dependent oxidoreductase [Syntrophaceae bacterium]|nr:FAD-dependent oxidoreductase [Syntrophaceae bacterium]
MAPHTSKNVVIIGSGIAGLTTAKLLCENGIKATIVEKSSVLGGHTRKWSCKATSQCQVCNRCSLDDVMAALENYGVQYLTESELGSVVRDTAGYLRGVKISTSGSEVAEEIPSDALALCVGFETYDPSEKLLWGYGALDGVMTLADLDFVLDQQRLNDLGNGSEQTKIAFFQCVGSRDKSVGANYCSQYCCKAALRSAVKLKSEKPQWSVAIFYIDLQVSGKYASSLLGRATESGIELAQGVPGEIFLDENKKLAVNIEKNGTNAREQFDKIILSVGQRPSASTAILSQITGVGLNEHGFFESRTIFDPNRTCAQGVYLAGACGAPMDIETTILNASAAASDIISDLSGIHKGA